MVLRAGYKRGPPRPWDIAGAAAGVATVLALSVFVVVAGSRAGYSQIHDTISKLGGVGQPDAGWFTAVNIVSAVFIILFAHGVQRRLPVGLATSLLLGGVAIGGVLVGSFRCTGACSAQTVDAHGLSARFTAVMIVAFMVAAGWALRCHPKGWFRNATLLLVGANLALFATLAVIVQEKGSQAGLFERVFWGSAYLWVLAASVAIILATQRRTRVEEFDARLVQRKILSASSACTHAAYLCCSIDDIDGTQRWIGSVIGREKALVRADDGERCTGSVTLAFSHRGLRALAVTYQGFTPDPFAEGMRARADLLGDFGESHPRNWQPPWNSDRVHMLIWVEATSQETLQALIQKLRDHNTSGGLTFLDPPQFAAAITPGPVEQLGFRDGISQPWLALRDRDWKHARRYGGGTLDEFGQWRPLAPGEFVLGAIDESGDVSPVPEPRKIFEHGSFIVVRKLAQNLAEYDRIERAAAPHLCAATGGFTARMMGRLKNGDPLVLPGTAGGIHNDFTYGDDPDGMACPLGAHIRRANPRDALGFGTLLSARHRIIRRGKPYEDPNLPSTGWDKGLMFVAVNARIDGQFEFIQRFWLNDGDRQRIGTSRDLIAGSSMSRSEAVLQCEAGPLVLGPVPNVLRTIGGEYFFAPSMAGLEELAGFQISPPADD